jgi:hypothetical protein
MRNHFVDRRRDASNIHASLVTAKTTSSFIGVWIPKRCHGVVDAGHGHEWRETPAGIFRTCRTVDNNSMAKKALNMAAGRDAEGNAHHAKSVAKMSL